MKLSVIILNYNVRYFLEQCIQSVLQATKDLNAEVIVVDNASADDSCAMVREKFPQVTLIANTDNKGFPKGNNQGVAVASGEYVCILNPDTVVAEDTFVKALDFAEKKEHCGIVGVKLIDGTGNFLPESKRGIPTPWVAFTKFSGLHKLSSKLFGKYYASHLSQNENGKVDILVGAFMLMKKEVYEQVGGFDETYFMFGEDVDLSYTVQKAGYENYFFSETTVIHYKGESTRKDSTFLKNFRDGMHIFHKKYFKGGWLFDLFLKIGIEQFSRFKMKQGNVDRYKRPQKTFVLSKTDLDLNSINNAIGLTTERLSDISQLPRKEREVLWQIVFDGNSFSNKEIISMLNQLRNDNFTFRILPKDCNFILGSDHSDSRGEAIVLQ